MTVHDVLRTLAASLAAALVGAAVGLQADACEPVTIRVHLHVDRSIGSRVITAGLKDEAEWLWKPYGIRLEWNDTAESETAPPRLAVEAILERQINEPDPATEPAVLGSAPMQLDALPTKPIRVRFDATRDTLAQQRGRPSFFVPDQELARALGRVLAHEIGHVLLSLPNHAETGLMRAVFEPYELVEPARVHFRLTAHDVGRLRSRIRVLTGVEDHPIDGGACVPSQTSRAGR